MSHGTELDAHDIDYVLTRGEWLRTEYPAVLVWGGWATLLLIGIALAAVHSSVWWALLLPLWFLGGAKATGILVFLLLGAHRMKLRVGADGALFVSKNGSELEYCHWMGFVENRHSFLLWGGDGRYRLIIPKRALTMADYLALYERTGIELNGLGPGEEVRLPSRRVTEGERFSSTPVDLGVEDGQR